MIRGTTPTFVLTISDSSTDLTEMDNVYATFKQGSTLLTKTGDDLDISSQEVDVFFTQSESLQFKANNTIEIQLNWTFTEDDEVKRGCTNIVKTTVGANLVEEVLE